MGSVSRRLPQGRKSEVTLLDDGSLVRKTYNDNGDPMGKWASAWLPLSQMPSNVTVDPGACTALSPRTGDTWSTGWPNCHQPRRRCDRPLVGR